jgi:hypothetical protein
MAKDPTEGGIVKRQLASVRDDPSKVSPPQQGRGVAGRPKVVLIEIDANDLTLRNRLGQAQRDCRSATPAIKECHVRAKMWEEEVTVDMRAARLDRGLHVVSCLFLSH